jgi:phosphopantothenoylcysteine decarboxylase/phosphopantothenate--cysteine ligase
VARKRSDTGEWRASGKLSTMSTVGNQRVASLAGTRVLLGVTGGIAAYKSADLVRRLRDAGAQVRVVMTDGAQQFVTPLTFQALSGEPVRTSLWDHASEAAMGHIELARWADRVLVAPASADFIARLAAGMSNDLLTTLCLASNAPLAVAPAMNQQMWANAATQANVATLRWRGVQIFGPAAGSQACGDVGEGRMLEPLELVALLAGHAARGALAGKRVLVSAGPTYEDIDPVRFVGNRSSGKMGFAVAEAAAAAGADVTMIAGPVSLATPNNVRRIDVRSAAQMRDAVLAQIDAQDVFIAAAAVADYTPVDPTTSKKKKSGERWDLVLASTIDILGELATRGTKAMRIGFAAETDDVERYAADKLERKQLAMIAANRVGQAGTGFEADDNAITLLWNGGRREIERAPKRVVADRLVEEIANRLAEIPSTPSAPR